MDSIIQLFNSIITTVVDYFRNLNLEDAGAAVKMIIENLNMDTIKTTFAELRNFFNDIIEMIKGSTPVV